MSEAVRLRSVALARGAEALSMSVMAGQTLALIGPAASGKSRLLRIIAGLDSPASGDVERTARAAVAGAAMPRRARVQSLARLGGPSQATRATEALSAVGLWDARHHSLTDLSPGQLSACELLAPLASDAGLLAIDGQLDLLDPWALRTTWELFASRLREGASLVLVTNRPDVVAQCDSVVALKARQPLYAGRVADLLDREPQRLEVMSETKPGVRALVEPLEVRVTDDGPCTTLHAREGQALAARLLTHGYGDVRLVVLRQRTIEEAILTLM